MLGNMQTYVYPAMSLFGNNFVGAKNKVSVKSFLFLPKCNNFLVNCCTYHHTFNLKSQLPHLSVSENHYYCCNDKTRYIVTLLIGNHVSRLHHLF